jgi:hypothetical protein
MLLSFRFAVFRNLWLVFCAIVTGVQFFEVCFVVRFHHQHLEKKNQQDMFSTLMCDARIVAVMAAAVA